MNRAGRMVAMCRKDEDGKTLEAEMSADPTLSKEKSPLEGKDSQS